MCRREILAALLGLTIVSPLLARTQAQLPDWFREKTVEILCGRRTIKCSLGHSFKWPGFRMEPEGGQTLGHPSSRLMKLCIPLCGKKSLDQERHVDPFWVSAIEGYEYLLDYHGSGSSIHGSPCSNRV
jgi:hypothetical protein